MLRVPPCERQGRRIIQLELHAVGRIGLRMRGCEDDRDTVETPSMQCVLNTRLQVTVDPGRCSQSR
jgi:hypothetical protein